MKTQLNLAPTQLYNIIEESPFHIRSIGRSGEDKLTNNFFQRDDHFLIIVVINGKGSYCINNQKGVIANNHLLFIKPGELNSLQLAGTPEGFLLSFSQKFLDTANRDAGSIYGNLLQLCAHSRGTGLGNEQLADLTCISTIMLKEYCNTELYKDELIKQYFKIIMLNLSRLLEVPEKIYRQTRHEELLNNFNALLEKNFRAQKMVADYAGALAVTPNYLNEVIKKTTGNSAGHHIRQRIALEAKRQALCTNFCMKNIAYDLGFYDMAHFSKFFKNTTGMSFSDFKCKDRVLQPVA
nr:helix-turn-helix transcriptional regulator [Mucilaginibacter sp. L294]